MSGQGRYNDRRYRRMVDALRSEVEKRNLPCWLCGYPIDTDLHWKEPMSFTADHLEPISVGGNLYGKLLPAHRACNSKRGNRKANHRPTISPPKTSRIW